MNVAVLIDGGHLRVLVRQKTQAVYNPSYIEKIAHACVDNSAGERLLRALYYDCPPYTGTATLPVSGNKKQFTGSDQWLRELASKDYFATRLGVLKFRGFKPKNVPLKPGAPLTDNHFNADFQQKGVDMRIGLDIAVFASTKAVERIILITNDTDCIPAMKHGRKAGLQVVLMSLPGQRVAKELLYHSDFHRLLPEWPTPYID